MDKHDAMKLMRDEPFPEGEISGVGGEYEAACRLMFYGALAWLREHPEAVLDYTVNGRPLTDDAKALDKAITELVPDCSSAMFNASLAHARWCHKNGWEIYRLTMKEA